MFLQRYRLGNLGSVCHLEQIHLQKSLSSRLQSAELLKAETHREQHSDAKRRGSVIHLFKRGAASEWPALHHGSVLSELTVKRYRKNSVSSVDRSCARPSGHCFQPHMLIHRRRNLFSQRVLIELDVFARAKKREKNPAKTETLAV